MTRAAKSIAIAMSVGFLMCAVPAFAQDAPSKREFRSLRIQPSSLGDASQTLVYSVLTPCRIVDTRPGASPILGGSLRSFKVAGTEGFAEQGGTEGGCGVPSGASAVLINFVAVNPQGGGNLKGAAYPNSIPETGSIINYQALTPVLNIANGITFPICDPANPLGCSYDITLTANGATTHLVADVLGFFSPFPTGEIITSVTAGTGLQGGGTAGDVSLSIAPEGVGNAELDTDAVTPSKVSASGSMVGQVLMSNGTSVDWQTPPEGDITGVTAGNGLTGGGTTGNVSVAANFGGSGSATTVARSDHSHYTRTRIVGPATPTSTPLQNGTALMSALAAVSGSAANPFLLKIEPGIYDIGSATLLMKQYVDIEGSGEQITKITHALGTSPDQATVRSNGNAELRFLTIESTGGGAFSTALYSSGSPTRARNVTLIASGGSSSTYGASIGSGLLEDVTVTVTAPTQGYGLSVLSAATIELRNVTINATETGVQTLYGYYNQGTLTADGMRITATSPNGAAYGFFSNAPFEINNSRIRVYGATSVYSMGLSTYQTTGRFEHSEILMTSTGGVTFGADISGSAGTSQVIFEHSNINSATGTAVRNTFGTVHIGGSKLEGSLAPIAPIICAGVWKNMVFYATCP